MYLRAFPHDDDVEGREQSGQDGAQIAHEIVALSVVHLEKKNRSRDRERKQSVTRVSSKSLFEINLNLIFVDREIYCIL